jgi:hypothetical protein
MTTSPERCLGGLIKDLDKDLSPREKDFDSKDETTYKTSSEQKLSLDSIYSFTSLSSLRTPFSEDNKFSPINKFSTFSFTKSSILAAFSNQRNTLILQKSLNNISKEEINNIIKEMEGTFSKIIKNKNGNYFCSDLLKVCDKNQRIKILKEISGTMCDDCVDEYGTHPIQTLVELSECEEEYKLILFSFDDSNKILTSSLNQNGSYVIQKIIVHIPERYRMEFNLMFIKYLSVLSMDMYSVCTVKKFIGYTKNELLLKQILNIILTNFVNISGNQYGNYLIQYLLEHWWKTNEGIFLKKICISKFHILAANHFSSYICDLFIKLASFEEKQMLMSSLIKDKTVSLLTNNMSGNIIMNKLMSSLKNQKEENKTKKHIPLSLNNIRAFNVKNRKEKAEEKDSKDKNDKKDKKEN